MTPARLRGQRLREAMVRIVNPVARKFIGFGPADALGYSVMMSDIEKTAIDCVDRTDLVGGIGEAGAIVVAASRRGDWRRAIEYLERIGSKPLIQRYGWLADYVGAEMPKVRAHICSDSRMAAANRFWGGRNLSQAPSATTKLGVCTSM